MLTTLEAFNSRVLSPPIAFAGAGTEFTDPFQIRGIDGLGPVTAAINSTPFGTVDGESFDGSSVGKRNIVLTVGLNPDWSSETIESLRLALYAYFMPKSLVTLKFSSTHMPTCQITGYVESFEPNIFAKDPEYQISIICPTPYFQDVSETIITGNTVTTGSTAFTTLNYVGTIPTGFMLEVADDGGGFDYIGSIIVQVGNWISQTFDLSSVEISSVYQFNMSSIQGNKYAEHIHISDGVITSLLEYTLASSVWPQLDLGANRIYVRQNGVTPHQVWRLHYFNLYGGL